MKATCHEHGKSNPLRFLRTLFSPRTLTPATQSPPGTHGAAPAASPEPSAQAPGLGVGKKILIVDDDPIILKTTGLKLRLQGYLPAGITDPADAIAMVRTEPPDLILLDLNFPPDVAQGGAVAWDGFLLMSWLRRLGHAGHIPVIVITGNDSAKSKERALACGAMGYFLKPIDHVRLLALIERIWQKQYAAPKTQQQLEFQI
jgi:CheY-like chemotaxis protein